MLRNHKPRLLCVAHCRHSKLPTDVPVFWERLRLAWIPLLPLLYVHYRLQHGWDILDPDLRSVRCYPRNDTPTALGRSYAGTSLPSSAQAAFAAGWVAAARAELASAAAAAHVPERCKWRRQRHRVSCSDTEPCQEEWTTVACARSASLWPR